MDPTPGIAKSIAAGSVASSTTTLAALFLWYMETYQHQWVPMWVAVAIAGYVISAATWLATYLTPHQIVPKQ